MTLRNALTAALLLLSSTAMAQSATETLQPAANHKSTLSMADLPANAFTNPQGTFVLHPALDSSVALTDHAELKASVLSFLVGPNVGLELRLFGDEDSAFSVEPNVATSWGMTTDYSGGVTARYTRRVAGTAYLTTSVGGRYWRKVTQQAPNGAESVTVPVGVNFDLQTSPHTIWDFHASTNAMGFAPGGNPSGMFGFAWFHSFGGTFQLGLGLNVLVGTVTPELAGALAAVNLPAPGMVLLPLPDVTFGFKF